MKRFSIFNFNKKYIPRSIWDAEFGDLGEVEEEPLYTTEVAKKDDPKKDLQILPYRPGKEKDIKPTPLPNFAHARDVKPILYTDKKDSRPDEFPYRDNNTLKVLHQRIINKDKNISGQKEDTVNSVLLHLLKKYNNV